MKKTNREILLEDLLIEQAQAHKELLVSVCLLIFVITALLFVFVSNLDVLARLL